LLQTLCSCGTKKAEYHLLNCLAADLRRKGHLVHAACLTGAALP